MAPDTTRDKLADDLSGTLPPSCKHMEREEYRDGVLQMLEDLEQLGRRDGCIAAAWALDALPSLQRELAEARREITRLRLGMSGAADSMVSLGRSDYAEMIRDWIRSTPPGPSDAKGEHIGEVNKLVPLTDESVRGVLVDDGEPTNKLVAGKLYIDPSDGELLGPEDGGVWNNNWQPVKLRPASEFGVPAEPLPVQVHRKLEAIAESLGIKDWQAAGTSMLASLIAEAVDKLKSTPAESSDLQAERDQLDVMCHEGAERCERLKERVGELEAELAKSVRVPEGWLLLKPDTVNYHIGWLGKYYAVVDPDTMPTTTTQSKLDDCEACLDDCNALVADLRKSLQDERTFAEKKQSESERLRKAIEEYKATFVDAPEKTIMDKARVKLFSALTPPTATPEVSASGERDGHMMAPGDLDDFDDPTPAPAAESERGDSQER